MMCSKKMWYVIPEISWAGIMIAISTGLLVPMIVATVPDEDQNTQLMTSMTSMITLGVGEVVGSLIIGQVIDRLGNRVTSIITLILIFIQTTLIVTFLYQNTYSNLVFAMTFVGGLQDSVVNTHMSEVLGFEFEDNIRPYSIFNIVQSISVFSFLTGEAFVTSRTQYYTFHITAGIMGMLMCSTMLWFPYKVRGKDIQQCALEQSPRVEFQQDSDLAEENSGGKQKDQVVTASINS